MKIILGSQSPRRKQLLEEMGYSFEVRIKETDESYPDNLSVEEIPVFIAQQKASALSSELKDDELLITADTIVALEHDIFGKPKNAKDAKFMLQKLANTTHKVVSGIVLTSNKKQVSKSVTTLVTFSELSEAMIDFYISSYQPYDKAGSYGIQEWIGLIAITKIEGSYTNVVGLPTAELEIALKKFSKERSQ